ncbi:hypothetical protein BDR26DRAFT_929467 [Obelidium mucronatum]|nr:hypothetical protein BDR26DRAFT_929467 [Obelidium mucronatum]
MDPLVLLPQHVRSLVVSQEIPPLPMALREDFALVAIIDLSGYSKLSSKLESELGSDSGAKIKEVINPPMESITKCVHKYAGSIVKLAGDAVIASWTIDANSKIPVEEYKTLLCINAFLCCIELLQVFQDYCIKVALPKPNQQQQQQQQERDSVESIFAPLPSINLPHTPNHRPSSAFLASSPQLNAFARRISYQIMGNEALPLLAPAPAPPPTPTIPMFETTLAIHIGLALGSLDHIHIGINKKSTARSSALRGVRDSAAATRFSTASNSSGHRKKRSIDMNEVHERIEYFIAGEALAKAGSNLNIGKQGDFVFTKSFNQVLKQAIGVSGMKVNNGAYIISDKDPIVDLRAKAVQFLWSPETTGEDSPSSGRELICLEGRLSSRESRDVVASGPKYLSLAKAYMDDSVSKIIETGNVTDQLRSVSVVFIKFGGFQSETIAESRNLAFLQAAATSIISKVKEFEGCIRQFNCDDKALTALLVWGLEGHAHEKGEAHVAMLAAIEISKSLKVCLEDEDGFSIGVTTGVVFAGIVGSAERCDNTVLGVAVNNAARLMCLDICHGRVLCDQETYLQTSGVINYGKDIPPVSLKGVPHPVRIYYPLGNALSDIKEEAKISGRTKEIEVLQAGLDIWRSESSDSRTKNAVLLGSSGIGKISLNDALMVMMEEHQEQKELKEAAMGEVVCHRLSIEAKEVYQDYLSRHYQSTSISRHATQHTTIGRVVNDDSEDFTLETNGSVDPMKEKLTQYMAKVPKTLLRIMSALKLPASYLEALLPISGIALEPSFLIHVKGMATALQHIFNAFIEAGLRMCFIIDDIHWCDSFSLELAADLLRKCPSILFVFSARPLEEWSLAVSDQFQLILEQNINQIKIGALNAYGIENMLRDRLAGQPLIKFKSVNLDIVREILDKGQGNPMVTDILINTLFENNLLCVKNGTLTREEGKELLLGMGSTTAVVAQFDKLTAPMKTLLRVFAMAGQLTFKLSEMCSTLKILKDTATEDIGVDITAEGILELIQEQDKYKFVKFTDDVNELGFCHYLIQQGIISAMVPSKREEIRTAFVTYYEKAVEAETDARERSFLRQSLIFHLIKGHGNEDKKKVHMYEAFVEAGEANQITDALAYYENVGSFDSSLNCADSVFKKVRECRILSKLHFEKGNIELSFALGKLGLEVVGCGKHLLSQNWLGLACRIYPLIGKITKVADAKNSDAEMAAQALPILFKLYPNMQLAAANLGAGQLKRPSNEDEQQNIVREIIDLVWTLLCCFEHTRPGPELFLLSLLITPPSVVSKAHKEHYQCQAFSLLATSAKLFRFESLYTVCINRSNKLFAAIYSEEYQERLSPYEASILSHIHEISGLLCVLEQNYSLAVVLQRNGFLLLANQGQGSTEKAFMMWQGSRVNVQRMGHHEEILRQWFEDRDCKYYHKGVKPFFLAEATSYIASSLANLNEMKVAAATIHVWRNFNTTKFIKLAEEAVDYVVSERISLPDIQVTMMQSRIWQAKGLVLEKLKPDSMNVWMNESEQLRLAFTGFKHSWELHLIGSMFGFACLYKNVQAKDQLKKHVQLSDVRPSLNM